jgi:polyhydroxyalkanoate synthase
VLLVPPLAAPASCFDLRRGCSLAEHLLALGHPTYLVDYGPISFGDRALGLEHWVDEVLPGAVETVFRDAGDAPIQLVGWCLGGILSLLAVAARELPVVSVATVASPFDFARVRLVAPLRPVAQLTGGRVVSAVNRALGGAPAPVVRAGYQLAAIDKYVTKPLTVARNLHDRDFLAQIEAVDDFTARMLAYPGRTFGQLYHRFFIVNDLAEGRTEVAGRPIDLANVRVPVLAVAGRDDGIAPAEAVHHVAGLLPNSPAVRVETAPGGHLGVLTGRAARHTTWAHLDDFLTRGDSAVGDRLPARAA